MCVDMGRKLNRPEDGKYGICDIAFLELGW